MLYLAVVISLFSPVTAADKVKVIKISCDYIVADGTRGLYLLEWFSGYMPIEGDYIIGEIGKYGFKDVYYPLKARNGRVFVEDYLLSESEVNRFLIKKCSSHRAQ